MGDSSMNMMVSRANEDNFMFAFNDPDFSDHVLRLEIIPCNSDFADSDTKLSVVKYHEWFSHIDATHYNKDAKLSEDGAKIKTLHLSAPILAAKSPFFYKLFKNDLRGSHHKNDLSFIINESEEATLMDLLKFMYGDALSATSVPNLVDVLIAADKFEVTSCMRYCIEMLLKFPMSMESALFYLELPSCLLKSEIVRPLIDTAKEYVVARHKDFTDSQKEAMELPLPAIELVLGREGLHVTSEDEVLDFIVDWSRKFFPTLEERREIITKCLTKLIDFKQMSCLKLKEVLVCPDFNHEQVSKQVMEALFTKVELSCGQRINTSKDLTTIGCSTFGRVYLPCCVVYFDLKKDELKSLFTLKKLISEPFGLGGMHFQLMAQCDSVEEQHHLGLYTMVVAGSKTCTVGFEYAVMNKSSKEFQHKFKISNCRIEGGKGMGKINLLGIRWTELINGDNDYLINDVIHLRAKLTLKSSQA